MMPLAEAVVWRTGDGGQSWQASQPLDLSGLAEVYLPDRLLFVDAQNGWLLVHVGVGMNHDYVALYRTTDGGLSWTRLLDPFNDGGIQSCQKPGLQFVDAQHGWLPGTCNGVAPGVLLFNTADGGATWQAVTLSTPEGAPGLFDSFEVSCGSYDPGFLTDQFGRIAVQCTHLGQESPQIDALMYTTQDGGQTWSILPYPGGKLFFINEQTGWALGAQIFTTRDGGVTWSEAPTTGWQAEFDFVSFVNEQAGWALVRLEAQTVLLQTLDGGQTWSQLNPLSVP